MLKNIRIAKQQKKWLMTLSRYLYAISWLLSLAIGLSSPVYAQETREQQGIRICSQNLNMLGRAPEGKKETKYRKYKKRKEQAQYLAERIRDCRCDIVAVQEIYGKNESEAARSIKRLISALEEDANESYSYILGETNNKYIRNGFIYRKDRVNIDSIESAAQQPVLRLEKYAAPRRFTRGPVIIRATLKNKDAIRGGSVVAVSFHFKSKVDGWKDVTNTGNELNRIETADVLREMMLRIKAHNPGVPVVALGDRNADSDAASARVLSGVLRMEDFRRACSVTHEGLPDCTPYPRHEEVVTGLFEKRKAQFGSSYRVYSIKYKGETSLYDEIYMPVEQPSIYLQNGGQTTLGTVGEAGRGSDHLLVWVELRL